MDVQEHFYTDDPSRGPADARTNLDGAAYYFLGNGRIQAAVQICAAGAATPLGLLLMAPGRFGPKRAALTFHDELGLQPTMIRIRIGDHLSLPNAASIQAQWTDVDGVPAVRATWRDDAFAVEELFYCPDRSTPSLVRRIGITGMPAGSGPAVICTGPPSRPMEMALSTEGEDGGTAALLYRLTGDSAAAMVNIEWCAPPPVTPESSAAWNRLAACAFDSDLLDHLYTAARNQLPAVIGPSGQMDGSIWQYNHEWVRDQAMVARSLTMLGEKELARTMLCRLLDEFITSEGATIDSDQVRSVEDVELDQNGELLAALKTYVDWTGDLSILREHWDRIRATAEFPLRQAFRHHPSGLLHNRREYWERHAMHGIEDGMELMNQFYVAVGLSDAACLARLVRRPEESRRWTEHAERLKDAILHDEHFALVHEGRFIKRRGMSGDVQATISATCSADLPPGIPLLEDGQHALDPDASAALPIAMEFIDPKGDLARRTLADIETLWNQRWEGGGYGRYHVTSEPDSPGPWPFPSMFIARAYLEAGDDEKVWRVLRWLASAPGGQAGSWLEFYGPRPVPPYPQVGIPPWTWAEIICFFIHHLIGVRPRGDELILRPRLLNGLNRARAIIGVRDHRIDLTVRRARTDEPCAFDVDGVRHRATDRGLRLPIPAHDLRIEAVL